MGIICIITMKNGAKRMLVSHSFIGEANLLETKPLWAEIEAGWIWLVVLDNS